MKSFFWDYRLAAEFPLAALDYAVEDSVTDGQPRLHWHNYYELGICTSGGGVFHFERKRYEYRAGDVFLINDLERPGRISKRISVFFSFCRDYFWMARASGMRNTFCRSATTARRSATALRGRANSDVA